MHKHKPEAMAIRDLLEPVQHTGGGKFRTLSLPLVELSELSLQMKLQMKSFGLAKLFQTASVCDVCKGRELHTIHRGEELPWSWCKAHQMQPEQPGAPGNWGCRRRSSQGYQHIFLVQIDIFHRCLLFPTNSLPFLTSLSSDQKTVFW